MATDSPASSAPVSGLDRFFEITKRGSNVGREVRGGIVTFFTMAYILALNPIIIGTTPDKYGRLISGLPISDPKNIGITMAMVAAGTALIAGISTLFMGVYGKFPIAIATGLGINALAAYVIAPQMSWPQTMLLIFGEGLVITLLVLTGFREAVFRAVPAPLRSAISVGIGLFICFIGLWDGGIVRAPQGGATPSELGLGGNLQGWPVFVFLLTLLVAAMLYARKVKGSLLIALVFGTILGVIVETVAKIGPMIAPGKDINPVGWKLNVPTLAGTAWSAPNMGTLFQIWPFGYRPEHGALSGATIFGMVLLAFSLLLSDFFDTLGTVVAVGSQANLLDEEGNPPRLKQILLVDSVAAMLGGVGGVSSNTSYIESSAGVGEGARTGLASVVTSVCFFLSVFLAPLVNVVPSEAAAPILVFVGFLMMAQVTDVDWSDVEVAFPAFLTIALMPFAYSITAGIGAGFIFFVLMKLVRGKAKEIHPLMWVVALAFLVYFAQGIIMSLVR